MISRRLGIRVVLVMTLSAHVGNAQSSGPLTLPAHSSGSLAIGDFVRIARVGFGREEGRVRSIAPGLRLDRNGATQELAWPSVDTLWVRGNGALVGTLIGAALGGLLMYSVESSFDDFYGTSRANGKITLQGAAVGAAVGLFAGSLVRRWSRRLP